MKRKMITAVTTSVLALGLIVAGTLAYLTDTAGPVKNTFTVGNIDIDLDEPDYEEPEGGTKLYPGIEVTKDPTVTVKADSEDSYVYMLLDNQLNFKVGGVDVVTLNIHNDWELVISDGVRTLYRFHQVVLSPAANLPLTPLFTTLTVDDELVTSDNIGNFSGKEIIISAFAHQQAEVTEAQADAAAIAHFSTP